jgi:hypothetical protein
MSNSQSTIAVSPILRADLTEGNMNMENDENNSKRRSHPLAVILGILIVILLIVGLLASVVLVRIRTSVSSKAYSSSSGVVELANSYIFASPLKAVANGTDKIRVTVFVLDSQGKGVSGKSVVLSQQGPLIISPVQPSTDELGRAIFDVTSSSVGMFYLEANIEGKILSQRVGLTFE